MALNTRQARFVQEYRKDWNATQAAIRAGYSKRTATAQGSRLLTHVEIRMELAKSTERVREKVDVSVEYVIKNLVEVAERCLQKVPVMIHEGKDVRQACDAEGEGVWEFDSSGANKSLELIGKHLGAFSEKLQLSGPGGKAIAIYIGGIKK